MRDQNPRTRDQRTNTTVAQLADELGRDLYAMYRLCNAQQVYANGPETEISPSNAARLRDAHHDYIRRRDLLRRMQDEDITLAATKARHLGSPPRLDDDPETATIARNLGVRLPRGPRTRTPRQRTEPPLVGTAAEAARRWPGISRERAQQIAAEWTGQHYFEPVDARRWWAANLSPDDAQLASVLRELGIRPEHMSLRVRGETIYERLVEHRMAPEQITRILREQGVL
jgi:hypothetical protein